MTLFRSVLAKGGSPRNIDELLDNLERMARETLAGLGEPTTLDYWLQNESTQTPYDDLYLDKAQRFTDKRRAVDVLIECRKVRSAITAGDAALAAWNTAYLITGVEQWDLDAWEKPIRTGVGRINQQRQFREMQVEAAHNDHDQWRQWQAELLDERSDLKASGKKAEQARILKKRYDITQGVQAISKQLEPRPKK